MNLNNSSSEYEAALLSINQLESKRILDTFHNKQGMKVVEEVIGAALESIGEKWESGEASLAQVYMAGLITEKLIEEYLPIKSDHRKDEPKMAICVLEDQHALGKRMVLSTIRSNGYTIIDFGQGLSVEDIVKKVIDEKIEVLLISTLMFASALKVKNITEKLNKLNYKIKIIVGGAPFRLNSNLWTEVGADADGKGASDIVNIIKKVVQ